ncbi:MAG: hypothetical protein ABJ360_22635 [Roseobacter sp.]
MTPDQAKALNEMQVNRSRQPLTCVNRLDGNHRDWNGGLGALVATVRGWECPFCDYKQDMPTTPTNKAGCV